METLTDDYVAYVQEHISLAEEACGDPQVLIEQRLDFSHVVPGGVGTGDCVIIADPTLQIIDLKYGQGVLAEAERNPQLMLYALGALHAFGSLYDIAEVAVTIFQPRSSNVSTWTITTRRTVRLRNLRFSVESGILFITLPSGRRLAYVKPRLGENRWGGTSITYSGVTTGRKWGRLETYGGKLVENIVQATARDLLVHAMGFIARAGHRIVMRVHDEIVIDEPIGSSFTVTQAANSCAFYLVGLPACPSLLTGMNALITGRIRARIGASHLGRRRG